MRILLLVHHWPPDVNSTGLLMEQLAKDLVSDGNDVSVITTFPHYEHFRTWPEYRRMLLRRTHEDGIRVHRVYSFARGKKTMVRRLLNYLTFNLMALAANVFYRPRPEVIFATNGSFFSGITSYLIGRGRIPTVYNVQDLYPAVPIRAGELSNPILIKILERIEAFMYSRAALVTVIAPSFLERVHEKSSRETDARVVPNFVDTDFIRPLPRHNEFSRRHDLDNHFVVSHAGNIGYAYDLTSLLDAAEQLGADERFLFLIIGDGVAKASLQAEAATKGLRNVRFLAFQPLEDLPWLRASSDVQVALYRPGAAQESMPSKVYEIMASGRPLLASAEPDSDVAELVQRTEAGLCVAPDDPEALVDALRTLIDSPELRDRMGQRGRSTAEEKYSRRSVADKYAAILEEVVAARS